MKNVLHFFAMLIIVILLTGCAIQSVPESDKCSICDYIPSHAPCIVNLSNGEIGEIYCYDPDPLKQGEISEYQRGGYFCFLSVAGLQGYLNACVPEAHIYVPTDTDRYDDQFYCNDCRELLSSFTGAGYVIADLREPKNPTIYPVSDGVEFSVRCYEVSIIESDNKDELEVVVVGTIKPENGGEKEGLKE